MFDLILISVAAFLAGVLNAIAGGGSFFTFPALVFTGVPPIAANATSTVAVFPGYLSSALGFVKEIRALDRRVLLGLVGLSTLGGVLGALLLLVTSPGVFRFLVPWLLLFATLLFAFDRHIRKLTAGRRPAGPLGRALATLAVTIYGGYFNGGLGIVLLALFARLGYRDMNQMNGLKSLLSLILSVASVITFALAGIIVWKPALVMMVSTTVGGYSGALVARRLPTAVVRAVVIIVGLVMSAAFFVRG